MIETRLFTSLEMLKKNTESGWVDVLLAGEEVVDEIQDIKDKIPQIMLLSEGGRAEEESEYYLLFKYQSAESLVREVLAQAAENDNIFYTQKLINKRAVEIIGVYAPFGGAGVTEYAVSMAEELAKKEQTLYVNMELFQGLPLDTVGKRKNEEAFCRGMSEVIFYLKQRKEKLALKLETIVISKNNLSMIPTVEDYRDLYSLNCEDIRHFLKVLLQQTEYGKIIFDIGFMSDAVLYLLDRCNAVHMPKAVTVTQKRKQQSFIDFLQREGYAQIEKNILFVERQGNG
jgi:hypothetical protein